MTTNTDRRDALRERYLEEHGRHADAAHGFNAGWNELAEACRVIYDGPGSFEQRVAHILSLTAYAAGDRGTDQQDREEV